MMPNKRLVPKEKKKKLGKPIEYTPEKLKELGEELIAYCEKEGVWHPSEFCKSKGKSQMWLYAIEKRHPDFTHFLVQAKEILAQKMIKLGIESGSLNYLLGRFTPIYLMDVKAYDKQIADEQLARQMKLEEYKENLKAKNEEEAKSRIDNYTDTAALEYKIKLLEKENEELKKKYVS